MIRKARASDWEQLTAIYAAARRYMAESGNPTQWGANRPDPKLLEEDIALGRLYVVCGDDDVPHGAFALVLGEDPTYAVIEGGAWKNDRPYGTIHRIAGDGTLKGLFNQCIAFSKTVIPDLRVDTHHDNATMRHLLEKHGFQYCGVIYVDDGTPRVAYQNEP